jgi:hypothetical protein
MGPTTDGARFAKRVFLWAAIYGIVALAPQYFLESTLNERFPPPITHAEHFYGFTGTALAWQFVFLLISRDVVRYRPLMLIGVLEKLAFGLPAIVLFAQARLSGVVLFFGLVDLVLGVLFVAAYRATATEQ